MKKFTAQTHVTIVLKSHAEFNERRYAEYRTFAKPGETQAAAIKRYMAARRRALRAEPKRVFPNSAEALANTKAYVEAYYALNKDALFAYPSAAQTAADYVRDLFGELSTNPTTWPDTDEVTVDHLEDCPACGATL